MSRSESSPRPTSQVDTRPDASHETRNPSAAAPAIKQGGRRITHASRVASSCPIELTIVTVVFNGASLLKTTAESVLKHKSEGVEYIVIDGGSKDGTVDTLQGLGDTVDYWLSEPDKGIYNAMNKAVHLAAAGSYILFLGAGDKLLQLPDSEVLANARSKQIKIIFGDVLIGDWLFKSSFSPKLQYRNTLHHQGLFILKNSPTDKAWFDESLKVFSDWDLNLALYMAKSSSERLGYTVAFAEPDGVSAKLHLAEIIRMIARRCGPLRALGAAVYHGSLHLTRRYAAIFARAR